MTNTLSLRASVSERGNLNGVASDFKNAQLAKTRDCHDSRLLSKSLESRNDDNAFCHTEAFEKSRSISKENTSSVAQNRDISVSYETSI